MDRKRCIIFKELEQIQNKNIKNDVEYMIKTLKEIRKQCEEEGLELSADQVIRLTQTATLASSLDFIADSIASD